MITAEPALIFAIRDLHKRRMGIGAGFELCIPKLNIRSGEVVLLRGESGSGKSTLLDILAMALKLDKAAQFWFRPYNRRQVDIADLWHREDTDELTRIRRDHIGYILQTGGLFSFLTVRENIALVCRLVGQPVRSNIEDLAERLGIIRQLDKLPGQLSVGERQRATIVRALVHHPKVVLADEPTASVDPVNGKNIMELFLDLVKYFGLTAVIVSHDWKNIGGSEPRLLQHQIEREGNVIRSFFWD
jgi:putative ABC transport system ATP-binding protein